MSINIDRPCGTFDRNYFQAQEIFRTPQRKALLLLLIGGMYLSALPDERLWNLHPDHHLRLFDWHAGPANHHGLLRADFHRTRGFYGDRDVHRGNPPAAFWAELLGLFAPGGAGPHAHRDALWPPRPADQGSVSGLCHFGRSFCDRLCHQQLAFRNQWHGRDLDEAPRPALGESIFRRTGIITSWYCPSRS